MITNTLFLTVINTVPCLIWVKDAQRRFITANWATLQHFGVQVIDDIIGKTDEQLNPGPLAKAYKTDEEQVLLGRALIDYEEEVNERGQQRWFLTTKTPYFDRFGRIIGIIGICQDITELHFLREAVKKQTAP